MTRNPKKSDNVRPKTQPDLDQDDPNPTRDLIIFFGQTNPTRLDPSEPDPKPEPTRPIATLMYK
jgi:hypothetical protein